jgi:hypothetical protein
MRPTVAVAVEDIVVLVLPLARDVGAVRAAKEEVKPLRNKACGKNLRRYAPYYAKPVTWRCRSSASTLNISTALTLPIAKQPKPLP